MPLFGIFGGTFDPIHIGHLALAERARADLNLDRVIFVPSAQPPHKSESDITAALHRMNMVRAAVAGNPAFEVSDAEYHRSGPSYTVETMRWFTGRYPDTDYVFLMGADSLLELETWKDVEGIVSLCRLAVVTRPGYHVRADDPRLKSLPSAVWKRMLYLEMPGLDISSSEIRTRIAGGRSVRYLVPDEVFRYVTENQLYQGGQNS